jgi:iron complex outermembrane receptor protein
VRRRLVILALPALLAGAGGPVEAQDSTARDTARLASINVVTSILTSLGPAVGAPRAARAGLLNATDVARWSPRTPAQLLAGVGGFSSYDDLGSPFKLSLQHRGFATSPVVGLPQGISVFLDGVPVNEPDAAQVNFDLLPLAHVSHVELLSGTASLLGPNSLGGAVNFVTERGRSRPAGSLQLAAGSYAQYAGAANLSGTRGGWQYYAGGDMDREQGWRQATSARRSSAFANVGRLGAGRGLTLQLLLAQSRAETAGSLPESVYDIRPDSNLSANDFEHLDQLHVALTGYRPLGRGRGSATLYARAHDAERFNVNQVNDPDVRSFSRNRTLGGSADWGTAGMMRTIETALRLGATGSLNRVDVRILADRTKFGGGDSLTTDVHSPIARGGLFAVAEARRGIATLSGGARYDVVRVPFRNRLRPARDTTSVFRRLNPRGALSLDVGGGVTAYGSLAQSFRAPAVIELACADPAEPCPLPFALGDDPPLNPVVATTMETGVAWARARGSISASLFRTNVRDDIFLHPYHEDDEPEGSTIDGFFANIARTRREGVELAASIERDTRWPWMRSLSARGSYGFTRATFQSNAELFSIREEAGGENDVEPGDAMPLVPRHTARGEASATFARGANAGLAVRYTGSQWLRGDEANETSPLAGYLVTDVHMGMEGRGWSASAVVSNIRGARYATFGTYNVNQGVDDRLERFLTPGQPRTVSLVLKRTFGR